MRHLWPRLIVGLLVIVLFLVLGISLYRVVMGLLGVVASGGDEPPVGALVEEAVWTQPPYFADDSDFDSVSAVREYAEPSSAPRTEP